MKLAKPSEPFDLTLHRYRSVDRKISGLIDRFDDMFLLVKSLDEHVATLEKDRYRHEVLIEQLRAEVDRLSRGSELHHD